MFRGLRFIAVGLAVFVFGGWLIAQRNPQAAPDTLEAIQDTLKQLQAQVKSLQETVKRLSKDNRNGKNLALPPPTAGGTPPRRQQCRIFRKRKSPTGRASAWRSRNSRGRRL